MWSFFSRDPTKDFAYEVGDKVLGLDDKSIWALHEGKHKVNVLTERPQPKFGM